MAGERINIVYALLDQAEALTNIAFTAKAHWGYPDSWLRHWREALTITPEYVAAYPTFVAMLAEKPVGFCSIQIQSGDALMDHLWVAPSFMRKGVGRALFERAEEFARASNAIRIKIVSDPHAEKFYCRMGAVTQGRESAAMDGQERFLLLMEKALRGGNPNSMNTFVLIRDFL